MNTYAIIDLEQLLITNTVIWDGQNDWQPPDGCVAVEIPTDPGSPGIGWTAAQNDDGSWTFTAPVDQDDE